jgi:hypothetical protein
VSARPRLSVPAAVGRAFGQVLERPQHLLAFLLLNFVVAVVLVAPVQEVLSERLDHSLYGDRMATGVSWRALDTILRGRPDLLGRDGLGLPNEPTGVFGQTLLAGALLFWLHTVLHCGYLATLGPRAAGSRGSLFQGAARHAFGGSLLALLAAALYGLVLALVLGLGGKGVEGLVASTDRESVALGLGWLLVAVALAGLVVVKVWSDLAKSSLVRRDTKNFLLAALDGGRLLLRGGGRYVVAYLAIGVVSLVVIALWWSIPGQLSPASTTGLLALALFQQLFVAARIGLRLAHLGATWNLYRRG